MELPEICQDWPQPRRERRTLGRWLGTEAEYRVFFTGVLDHDGPDALAVIYMQGKATRSLTRYFATGVPMHTTGETTAEGNPLYFIPARAALNALEAGLVTCRKEIKKPRTDAGP